MEEKQHLHIEGMTCSNCALGVTKYLEKQGLTEVYVDFSTGEVSFQNKVPPDISQLSKGIKQLGYHLVDPSIKTQSTSNEGFLNLENKLIICIILTLPLLLHMVVSTPLFHNPWFQFILALPVFIIGLLHFGKSALGSLRTRVPNMDVLITIGSSSAFIYTLTGWVLHYNSPLVHNYLFFETTASIITLVLLGNYIEKRSIKKTTSAIRDLVAMQPLKANRITINSSQTEEFQIIDIDELKKDDALLIKTGEQIPCDGKIYFGNATVDESMMTGESFPVEKKEGDNLFAGTLNISGTVKVIVERTGNQTALSNIIDLVKSAHTSKPKIQKLGDKISAWFVPAVLVASLLTFLANYFLFEISITSSLMRSVAVLVISCPCAMGLAAPTAVAVGIGRAARNGILIKGGATLELFDDINTAVFDKTGTLTTGDFKIEKLNAFNINRQDAINLIVSIEQHSNHPIAQSIVSNLSSSASQFIEFETVNEIKGAGIHVTDAKKNNYKIGSKAFHKATENKEEHQIYLSKNDEIIAGLTLSDSIRQGAKQLITSLQEMNINTVLLSGDSEKRCKEVGAKVGIKAILASKLPDEKSKIISELKKNGRLLMVGDGINDAPSLASADIGVSFSDASKIAINSAEVVLLKSDEIYQVHNALLIGKQTLLTIKQNFFWAFFYNVIAIPFAAMGFLSPMVAALSMAFSDVIVIGNSIRLNYKKINGTR